MASRLLAPFVLLTCVVASAQTPRMDRVTPGEGPIGGGTTAIVSGANFAGAAVTIDQVPVVPLSLSDSEIRLVMPPHDNGYASIAVRTAAGSAYGEFLYVPPPLESLPPGFITTIVGIGNFTGNYRPATRAVLTPGGIAYSGESLFIADTPGDRVLRVRGDGVIEPFAGNGRTFGPRPSVPTPALEVSIAFPRGIAVDDAGHLYVPDTNYYLWRITPSGTAQIIAGTGREGFSGDGGPAVAAQIGHPNHVAVDGSGNTYFIDWTNMRIRRIDSSGKMTTIAGNGTRGFSGDDGPATQAQFDLPTPDEGGLSVDEGGNLFLLDFGNRRIRRIDAASGNIATVVGPDAGGRPLTELRGITAAAGDGALYFTNGSIIFRRSKDGEITRLSSEERGFSPDGTLLIDARLEGAGMLAIGPAGELTFSEAGVGRVRKVGVDGRIVTLAGSGPRRLNEGGPAHSGIIVGTNVDLDFLPTGELIFGEDDRLRKVDAAGTVHTIAGVRSVAPAEGVPELPFGPMGIDAGADGLIHIAGWSGILSVDGSGSWELVAGSLQPICDLTGDEGIATAATFCQAWDVARDAAGNLFIADSNNNRVRRVDARTGVITTIAGSGPPNGYERYGNGRTCGDGGPAIAACLNTPYGVAVDDDGNVYIAHVDTVGRIRKVTPGGLIATLAELPATKLELLGPVGYAVSGDRVVRIEPDGSLRLIAGGNGTGFGGDGGPATNAKIYAQKQSHGVAIDREGNLFFSDGDNRRIRAVRYGAVLAPADVRLQVTTAGSMIRATAVDAAGRPLPSVRIELTSPTTGPSCRFAGGATTIGVMTGPDGVAAAVCAPNCLTGTYTISVQATGGPAAVSQSMTNSECGRRRSVRH